MAKSPFAGLTQQMQAFSRILGIHASGISQARINADFKRLLNGINKDDALFNCLSPKMKKSLLRGKWYLENEEMDPEMVSSELRDVNAMLGAVEDGIDEPLLSGLDTSIDEQYMSLYREAIAKLKGEETSIYGVDNDVLPPNAKPNPESPYNSGQVEENISLEDNSELRRIQELVKFR